MISSTLSEVEKKDNEKHILNIRDIEIKLAFDNHKELMSECKNEEATKIEKIRFMVQVQTINRKYEERIREV